MREIKIKKNYVFTEYIDKETNMRFDMKKVKQVLIEVTYEGQQHRELFDLKYDTDRIYDMGCCGEIVNCYITGEYLGFESKVYLIDILEQDGNRIWVINE